MSIPKSNMTDKVANTIIPVEMTARQWAAMAAAAKFIRLFATEDMEDEEFLSEIYETITNQVAAHPIMQEDNNDPFV